jgi:hypothetical protein
MAKGIRGERRSIAKKAFVILGVVFVLLLFAAVEFGFYKQAIDFFGTVSEDGKTEEEVVSKPGLQKVKVAIVIDDMGRDIDSLRRLLEIDIPITVAVLPYLAYSREVAEETKANGGEVLLHLPMEPRDMLTNNPGKGALLIEMTEEEVTTWVESGLDAIPYIDGVSNHMGSRFTEDERLLKVALEVIKKRGDLFFLDSRTTTNSMGYELAREMGIRTAERKIFLDNERNMDHIKEQVVELIRAARRDGKAIAIGHPHEVTFRAIQEMVPRLKEEGIEVVNVSELID